MASATNGADPQTPVPFRLVHAVRGRTRLRVDPPHDAGELARAITDLLRGHPGVREIRLNEDCQSVVVTYDPDVLQVEDLLGDDGAEPRDSGREWWASWLPSPLSRVARGVRAWLPVPDAVERLAAWLPPSPPPIEEVVRQAREAGASTLHRLERAWRARRGQINAMINFWSASSVVARTRRPARSTGKDGGRAAGAGRR
jgi:hypothetical protein